MTNKSTVQNSDKKYMKIDDPWECANSVLAGYASQSIVNQSEADILVAAVAGRYDFKCTV